MRIKAFMFPSQVLCPSSLALSSGILCPGEMQLKYRLIRFTLDGLDMAIVECDACLSLQLEPIRLTNCNMHGLAQRNGLFAILPGVRLVQYIRPSGKFYFSCRRSFLHENYVHSLLIHLWFCYCIIIKLYYIIYYITLYNSTAYFSDN